MSFSFPESDESLWASVFDVSFFDTFHETRQFPLIYHCPHRRVNIMCRQLLLNLCPCELFGQRFQHTLPAVDVAARSFHLESQQVLVEHRIGYPCGELAHVLPDGRCSFLVPQEPRQHTGAESYHRCTSAEDVPRAVVLRQCLHLLRLNPCAKCFVQPVEQR